MQLSAIQDVITIVGSAYLQPITDLVDKLLTKPVSKRGPGGTSMHEHGYSAALIVLLAALLESYTARLRFVRREESIPSGLNTPDLLERYFPTLHNQDDLTEVFLTRNSIIHNHIWHLDISDFAASGTPTIANPYDLGFKPNKNYAEFVDFDKRVTKKLRMNVDPTAVNRFDVLTAFEVVWGTLKFMNAENFQHTPLAGSGVTLRRRRCEFEEVFKEIRSERYAALTSSVDPDSDPQVMS